MSNQMDGTMDSFELQMLAQSLIMPRMDTDTNGVVTALPLTAKELIAVETVLDRVLKLSRKHGFLTSDGLSALKFTVALITSNQTVKTAKNLKKSKSDG